MIYYERKVLLSINVEGIVISHYMSWVASLPSNSAVYK